MGYEQYISLAMGTAFAVLWMALYIFSRKKYEEIIAAIDKEEYTLSRLFFIGFGFLEFVGFHMEGVHAKKRMREMSELYDRRYVGFYFYVLKGAETTYVITIMAIAGLLAAASKEIGIWVLGIVLAALAVYGKEDELNEKLKHKRENILMEFPGVLSKMTLLVDSGLVMRDAWKKIAYRHQSPLYLEMQKTVEELDNGWLEVTAYKNFAERCNVPEIRKFASMVTQNLQKGSSEQVRYMREMVDEMWERKKHIVKKRGDAAASKLLIPTLMIFMGILMLIIVPMVSAIQI